MKGMLIPVDGEPKEIDIEQDDEGSTLASLQRLVGGNIEPFDVIFGDGISVYVNEGGLFTCPPNRAIYATEHMEDTGYLSLMDFSTPVKQGELHSILFGDLVAVGFDMDTGDNRDLTPDEIDRVTAYFTDVSKPGSGMREVIAIQNGIDQDPVPERVSLKTEVEQARAASDKLADALGMDSLAREDPTVV